MSSEDIPKARCGFVLEPGDVPDGEADDYEAGSDEWYEVSDAVCCWRPVWEGRSSDRCIWHTDTEDKPADALIEARADGPERLDGAYVPAVELGDAIDFDGCSLQAATFDGTSLRGASFVEVNGRYIEFVDSDLDDAQFRDANLGHALFSHCSLAHTRFRHAHLEQARFNHSDLRDARFRDANLWRAEFITVNLSYAEFTDADLLEARFSESVLYRAGFLNASLFGAKFPDANLREAQFHKADLREAEFPNADITDVDFLSAALERAEFPDANVEDAQFPDDNSQVGPFLLSGPESISLSLALRGLERNGILFFDDFPDEDFENDSPTQTGFLNRILKGQAFGSKEVVDSWLTVVLAVVGGSVAFADSLGIGIGAFDQYWFQLSIVLSSALLILGLSVLRIRWELEELLEVTDVFSD